MKTIQELTVRISELSADRERLEQIRKLIRGLKATAPGQIIVAVEDALENVRERIVDYQSELKDALLIWKEH